MVIGTNTSNQSLIRRITKNREKGSREEANLTPTPPKAIDLDLGSEQPSNQRTYTKRYLRTIAKIVLFILFPIRPEKYPNSSP